MMAALSAERSASIAGNYSASDFDLPLVPLNTGSFGVIAEIKERSPSAGMLATDGASRSDRARQYAQGGAAAISVLTEPSSFNGDISHLEEVVAAVAGTDVPVMRKDFLVDPKQILEARAAGASGVLLIVAMLDDRRLASMLDSAAEHSLFVLLESFDVIDLERTARLLARAACAERAASGQLLIGVNSRDLRTLHVDPARLEKLAPRLPEAAVTVAESGIGGAEDVRRVAALGYRAVLVGTALMRRADPAALINEMLLAGRDERAPGASFA
jgi:indole-3-glycerol phosphate synthase